MRRRPPGVNPEAAGGAARGGSEAPRAAGPLAEADRLFRLGRHREATALCRQTLRPGVDARPVLRLQAKIHHAAGELSEALSCLETLLAGGGAEAEDLFAGAICLEGLGRPADAAATYLKVTELSPKNHEAHLRLAGLLASLGHSEAAIRSYENCVALRPGASLPLRRYGIYLAQLGRSFEAQRLLERAVEVDPEEWEVYLTLGGFHQRAGRHELALHSYEEGLRRNPSSPELLENCGVLYSTLGRYPEALERLSQALTLSSGDGRVHTIRGIVRVELQQMEEAVSDFERAAALNPGNLAAFSNLLFYLHYADFISPAQMAARHREYGRMAAEKSGGAENRWNVTFEPKRRLRVGYLSPDFRAHSVAFFLSSVIKRHRREEVEVFCYAYVESPDAVTGEFERDCDVWRNISPLSDEGVDRLIRDDRIDLLVDLAGHTVKNRLPVFFRKPAPLMVSWLGYPDTTGLEVMDYRLTDEEADPTPEADAFASERLIRLKHGFHCYTPHPAAPLVSRLPALDNGYITFGSFNNLNKVSPACLAQWASVLRAVPRSRLLLKAKSLSEDRVREGILSRLEALGIERHRVETLGRSDSIQTHLALYHGMDVGLDTAPYQGTTTTFEALYMGVPVLTLAGDRHAGRVGVSILTHAGLPEWISPSLAALPALAHRLVADTAALALLRTELRARLSASPLMDEAGFVCKLEAAYRSLWEECCLRHENRPAVGGGA